jgi:DNA repair protein RadC
MRSFAVKMKETTMAIKQKASKKTAYVKKGKACKPAYLREIQIRYKKKRVKADSPIGKKIVRAEQVVELFSDLQNETKEKVITISLDTRLRIICFEVVAIGSLNSISFRPFEVIRAAIPLNPYGIIMVHNHPSGDPEPTREDKEITKRVKLLADAGGFAFHDHIIIGDGVYYSFAEQGLL